MPMRSWARRPQRRPDELAVGLPTGRLLGRQVLAVRHLPRHAKLALLAAGYCDAWQVQHLLHER
eukprot:15463595-Heterocapsa_arctica.AAC.1